MLFTAAGEYLALHIGKPTLIVGPPIRQQGWMVPCGDPTHRFFQVKLEETLPGRIAYLSIADAYALGGERDERVLILEESDFAIALERVRAHMQR